MRYTEEVEFSTKVDVRRLRDARGRFTNEVEEIEVTVTAQIDPGEREYRHADPGMCTPGRPASAEIVSVEDEDGNDVSSRMETSYFMLEEEACRHFDDPDSGGGYFPGCCCQYDTIEERNGER